MEVELLVAFVAQEAELGEVERLGGSPLAGEGALIFFWGWRVFFEGGVGKRERE